MLQTLKLLLPALIPSWRFFDEIAPSPRIEFALLKDAHDTPERWQEFRPRPARVSLISMLKRMVWNPYWNESLFLVSCAERLIAEPTDHSRQEILNRVDAELGHHSPAESYVQFRLVFLTRNGADIEKEITYISPVHRCRDGATS